MRLRLGLLCLLFLIPGAVFAQGGLYDAPVLGANGRPIPSASAQVCSALGVQGQLCTPTITVYSDQGLSQALSLPLSTDASGNMTFWVAPGVYFLTTYGAGIQTNTRAISVPCLPNTGCSLTGSASSLTSASMNPAQSGVIRLAVGDTHCWRNNANTADLCFSINGSDALLFNSVGLVQTNVSNTFTANQTVPALISSTANPSSGGFLRLANTDQHCWRNAANTGNDCLSVNSSDQLLFLGATVVTSASTNTFTNKTYNTNGSGNNFQINGTQVTGLVGGSNSVVMAGSSTGSLGSVVFSNSPTIASPTFTGTVPGFSMGGNSLSFTVGSITSACLFGANGSSGGSDGHCHDWYWNGSCLSFFVDTSNEGTLNGCSDRRIKENFVPLHRASSLAMIEKLRPYSYDYKKGTIYEGWGHHLGLIAQDVQKVIPSAVSGTPDGVNADGSVAPESIDYKDVVAVLIGAVQELNRKLDEANRKINELELK